MSISEGIKQLAAHELAAGFRADDALLPLPEQDSELKEKSGRPVQVVASPGHGCSSGNNRAVDRERDGGIHSGDRQHPHVYRDGPDETVDAATQHRQ